MKTQHLNKIIESGFFAPGYWAKCDGVYPKIYEGGYRTERTAVNAVKRKLDKRSAKAWQAYGATKTA